MIDVACALIVREDGKVLVAQRSVHMKMPLKMEFPGGKVEPGETAENCLIREIAEELQVQVSILALLPAITHQYPDFTIRLKPFLCKIMAGTITLKEHAACFWCDKEELATLDWAAADIPIVSYFVKNAADYRFL